MELIDLPVHELAKQLESKKVSSVEVTDACIARIEKTAGLGAYLHVDAQGAKAQAAKADERRAAGKAHGPWDGVPIALKDIFLTEGLPTTCGSKILENFVAPYDGTAVKKLKEAGSVLLGKLNMDEFAMGSSNEHSAFQPAKNPWDTTRVPGGSSGGSAVAVAAGSCYATLGTDTGGSIRQPAGLCGIVGLKPTYGRVSRYGVIAFASSLDQVGPMTKDVTDAALMMQAISGHDERDSTSSIESVPDYSADLDKGVKGLKIGVPKEYFIDGMDPEIRKSIEDALALYKRLGAELVEVSLPHTDYGIAVYYLVATAEASSNLARYDGVRYGKRVDPGKGLLDMYTATRGQGFGAEVKRRIMLGTYALSSGYYEAYYVKAQKVRTLVAQDFAKAFSQCDVIVTPTSPNPAFKLGENEGDPLKMYLADVFTVNVNLAGLPGLSLPSGFTKENLPIGMQVLGKPFSESMILRVGRAFEREHDFSTRRAIK